jgi:hypothetical protein
MEACRHDRRRREAAELTMSWRLPARKLEAIWSTFTLLLLAAIAIPASAHFLLNLNVRIFHVEHLSDGITIYLRTPMPYLVADRVGPPSAHGLPKPAPYTTNRIEEGKLVHFVDPAQLRRDPKGLGALAADGLHLVTDRTRLEATVEQVQVHRIGTQPGFATLDEAKAVFTVELAYPNDNEPLYVGDTIVDIILRYRPGAPVYNYSVSSTLDPGLPGQDKTANLILDYSPGGTKVFRARGLLAEPVSISRSALSAIGTFLKEGVRHILEGLDHVLFILCLVLGATRLSSLAWRVTGFTIGHSITLTAGFFGFVPSGAWFVPAVETAIALSIIYAAAIVLLPHRQLGTSERNLFAITSAIGLVHGLGFSFVLHKILQVDAPNIWQSLLAFNLGVEIGQLIIILAVWPAFHLIQKVSERVWYAGRIVTSAICIGVAALWTWQRVLAVAGSL